MEVRYRVLRNLIGIMATLPLACSVTRAGTLTDPLDNWSLTTGHTSEMLFDVDNGVHFFNDRSRVKCNGGTASTFYYHLPGVKNFAVYTFFWNSKGGVAAYVSPDGNNWSPISVVSTAPQVTAQGSTDWTEAQIGPAGPIPAGTNFVAFTLQPDQINFFTPEIGQVAISYDETATDTGTGPGGLIVTPVDGGAHLDWYPVKGAKSYIIQRRTAKTDDFHRLAAGINATSYVDSGLKPGFKYYYVVKAQTDAGMSGPSEEVLATSTGDEGVFVDSLSDLSLVIKHSEGLATSDLFGGAVVLHRTGDQDEFVEYKLTGATSFALNVFTVDVDPSPSISAEASVDENNWSQVPISFKLTAGIGDRWYGSVCTPVGKLPAGTNFVRFRLRGPSIGGAPQIAQVRLMSASPMANTNEHASSTRLTRNTDPHQ